MGQQSAMEEYSWPEVHQVLGHEVGNMVNSVVIAEPSRDGQRRVWDEGNEVVRIYQEFSSALKEGDELAAEAALEDLRAYDTPATPEYPRENIQRVLSLIDAARAYEDLLDPSTGEVYFDQDDRVELGEVLKPFKWYDGVETDYDPEVEVSGNSALRLISNTIIKNWKEHTGGPGDTNMWVEYEEGEDFVEVDIYDDGPGVEETAGIFEVDPEDPDSRYGLGFASALAEEFDGSLTHYSPETGGMGHKWELEKP